MGGYYRHLSPEDIITSFPSILSIKTGLTKVRPFLPTDAPFPDIEGLLHTYSPNHCICQGPEDEQWSCSQMSVDRNRIAVGAVHEGGWDWVLYKQRDPLPVACFDIPFPFVLHLSNTWHSQPDGGVVTWNRKRGRELCMRLVKRSVFQQTYERVQPQYHDNRSL